MIKSLFIQIQNLIKKNRNNSKEPKTVYFTTGPVNHSQINHN